MNMLERVRKANPHLPIYSVYDPRFARYGAVLPVDTEALCQTAEAALEFPQQGRRYVPSVPELEALPQTRALLDVYCGQQDYQMGLCFGHSDRMNAMEWHGCNEINVAVRELVMLLAKREELDADGRLDSSRVVGFYLARGEAVEVYSDTLHFAPCEVTGNGFSCIVGLQRGTNLPLDPERGGLAHLRAVNKWLLAHEENRELLDTGAFPGVYGENWRIYPV